MKTCRSIAQKDKKRQDVYNKSTYYVTYNGKLSKEYDTELRIKARKTMIINFDSGDRL